MTALEDAWMTAEADAYAMTHGQTFPHSGLDARQEACDALAQAYLAIGNHWAWSAETHLETARLAAAVAFPIESAQSRALYSLVAAAEAEAAAAGLLDAALS